MKFYRIAGGVPSKIEWEQIGFREWLGIKMHGLGFLTATRWPLIGMVEYYLRFDGPIDTPCGLSLPIYGWLRVSFRNWLKHKILGTYETRVRWRS